MRRELEAWSQELTAKPELIILTKSDTRDSLSLQHISDSFVSMGKDVVSVSAIDDESVKVLQDRIVSTLHAIE